MSEPTIPTVEEVAALPRWAQVAFAARCARRVLPLFRAFCPPVLAERFAAVERAMSVAAASAAVAHADASDDAVYTAAADAAIAAADVEVAHLAAGASANAARAAAIAASSADASDYASAAALAAARAGAAADAIRLDFGTLQETARQNRWDDNTPVSPAIFGPLWPNGPPPKWPSYAEPSDSTGEPAGEADRGGGASIDTVSPPAVVVVWDPRTVSPKQYAKFVAALDRLAKSQGGAGLKRLEGKSFGAGVKQGVPV